ncbi:lysoplasmalogenase-like protein TMEM86A [Sitophilus oryzae]|uniref:lysoplasmalogenase n=1 Tax=Sitophilus oryzae TaxID=7048 RepID=A0A6J2XY34_SITOR|nr:lysoplasmalogenase-like protein TMEM86A [Sitophilus oryzae]
MVTTPGVVVQVRSVGKHLLPYFVSVIVYFWWLQPYGTTPTIPIILRKCAPIISLMYFIVIVGFKKQSVYPRRIFLGLVADCIGDMLILWDKLFLLAMLAFSVGHINYIIAFQLIPLKPRLGLVSFCFGIGAVAHLYPGLAKTFVVGVPIYCFLMNLMIWRAAARLQTDWTWLQLVTCIGAVLFGLSDFIIGTNQFLDPIPHAQVLIISTYYAAQLGIALSVMEPPY